MRFDQEVQDERSEGFRGGPRGWGGHFRGPRPEGFGRRGGFRGPGPEGFGWRRGEGPDQEVREAGARLMAAFVQASRTGDADQREKAKAIADEARRSLYRLLAEEQ